MCAPSIIDEVRREISRRRFLIGAGAVVGAAASGAVKARAQEKPLKLAKGFRDVYDLTHTFSPSTPVFPSFKPLRVTERFTIARDGFYANEVTFDEHTGTHLDAPIHFVANALTADRIPPDRLIAPLVVVAIKARADKDPDASISVDDLLAWEKSHGRLPSGAFVAMYSGWDARVGDTRRFLNADSKNVLHFPGFSGAAAAFLVKERDIVGVGVDTLSLDRGAAQKFEAHLAFLGAGKYGVELLANLGTVPPSGATIIVGAPKHSSASGGPARVLAVA
jgi:kynurenine formamidase